MIDCDDLDDLRAEDTAKRRYRNKLLAHPHPQDPDHPGFPDEDDDGERDNSDCIGRGNLT